MSSASRSKVRDTIDIIVTLTVISMAILRTMEVLPDNWQLSVAMLVTKFIADQADLV